MRRAAPLPALLLFLALAAAGCGDSEKDDFADEYKPLNGELLELGRRADRAISTAADKSNAQIAADFEGVSGDLRSLNLRLKQLDPPQGLTDEVSVLTNSVDDAVRALADIGEAAGSDRPAQARTATVRFVAVSREVNEAQNKLAEETGADKGDA